MVAIRMPEGLLSEVDALAAKTQQSRATTLRQLIQIGVNRLRDGRQPE